MLESRGVSALLALAILICARGSGAVEPTTATDSSDTPQQLEEVVVNARKRDERVLDIPESIAVISATDLAGRGIESIEDVGRQTPNLQMNMRQDLTTNVAIRGVGAYGDVLGVGFSIDDVPNFTDQTMRPEDLESVQILKGPQGTLYGDSSIGGLVRYVSRRPQFNWEGEATAEVGNYSHIGVSGAQNIPLIDGVLAMRVSAYDFKDDGFVTNSVLNINANPLTDYGARLQLLYKPTDNLDALLVLRHSFIQNGGDIYIPVPRVYDYTWDAQFFQPQVNSRKVNGVVLQLNDDLGFAKFTSISSYTNSNSAFNIDASQTPPGQPGQNSYTLPHNRPTEVTTQELRLTSPSGGHFEWLVGLYGAIIKNVILNQIGATYLPTPDVPTELYDFDTRRTDTAVFGTLTYHLGSVRLDAGARATRTLYEAQLWVDAPGPPDQYGSIVSRGVLPKFSLSYTLPGGAEVYATAAKGEEPGAINTNSGAPVPYLAETAWSYELGAKGELLDRRLEYELAGFDVRNHNQQFQSNLAVPNLGLLAVTTNIGDSRSYGAEASINWRLSDRWRLGISGGYLNAMWLNASYFGQPINGLQVQNSPHVTASTNIAYSQPAFNGLRFDANVDMSYTDAMWWDPPNTPGTKEHPHFLGDARVALGTDGRGWQVALRGTNLLGAKYWTEYVPSVYPPSISPPCPGCTDLGTPGARRQFFGSVTYKY